jgi:hypothetical protein
MVEVECRIAKEFLGRGSYLCMLKFVTNKSPFVVIDFKVSKEVWSDKPVDFSILKIFGYLEYFHVQSGERLKLYPKFSKMYIF